VEPQPQEQPQEPPLQAQEPQEQGWVPQVLLPLQEPLLVALAVLGH
jgi:hypothetical protein